MVLNLPEFLRDIESCIFYSVYTSMSNAFLSFFFWYKCTDPSAGAGADAGTVPDPVTDPIADACPCVDAYTVASPWCQHAEG
jgi:hypothetical protein